jgi:hypothetical protein
MIDWSDARAMKLEVVQRFFHGLSHVQIHFPLGKDSPVFFSMTSGKSVWVTNAAATCIS